jgi:hypothetical protein
VPTISSSSILPEQTRRSESGVPIADHMVVARTSKGAGGGEGGGVRDTGCVRVGVRVGGSWCVVKPKVSLFGPKAKIRKIIPKTEHMLQCTLSKAWPTFHIFCVTFRTSGIAEWLRARMSGEDAPRPYLENLIVPEIKTNKQTNC